MNDFTNFDQWSEIDRILGEYLSDCEDNKLSFDKKLFEWIEEIWIMQENWK